MPQEQGGIGLDAVWADDFHHQMRVALAGDHEGYYTDFTGSATDIAETLNRGWFYRGQHSKYRKRRRGTDADGLDPRHFVYCIQNHDQIGNRPLGDRLNSSIDLDAYKAASALLLLSPYTPLLFQGQEWAAGTPFLYFTDHNAELGKLVTEGRRAEFAHFEGFKGEDVPDPQSLDTFLASKLRWDEVRTGGHGEVLDLYRNLLAARRRLLPAALRSRASFRCFPAGKSALVMRYSPSSGDHMEEVLVVVNLGGEFSLTLTAEEMTTPPLRHHWSVELFTGDWRTDGSDEPVRVQQAVSGVLTTTKPGALLLTASRSQ